MSHAEFAVLKVGILWLIVDFSGFLVRYLAVSKVNVSPFSFCIAMKVFK